MATLLLGQKVVGREDVNKIPGEESAVVFEARDLTSTGTRD
jgi:hypothetical protein